MTEKELRELDAEIAVEVMGYVYVNGRDDGDGDKYTVLMLPEEAAKWCKRFPYCRIEKEPWAKPFRDGCPAFEELFPVSIAAGELVMKKLREIFWPCVVSLIQYAGGEYSCIIESNRRGEVLGKDRWSGKGPSAALAISQAALAAVRSSRPASGS